MTQLKGLSGRRIHWLWIAGGSAAAVLAFSLLPGPDTRSAPGALLQPSQIEAGAVNVVRQACADCHSNQTQWPWYSRIPPASWLIQKDVSEGRKFLNFSIWQEYSPEIQGQLLRLSAEQMRQGSMPPRRYSAIHRQARLSDQEKSLLITGLERESARVLKQAHSNQ